MNLATGIMRLALSEPRKPRLTRIDEEIDIRLRVSPLDLDYNLHMNNARYFTAMELARLALMVRAGLLRMALKHRWVFVNAAQKAVFFRPLKVLETYSASCRVVYMDDEWLYLKQHLRRQQQLVATGLFKQRVKQGRETCSPREIAARLGFEVAHGTPPQEVIEWEKVNALLLQERKKEGTQLGSRR